MAPWSGKYSGLPMEHDGKGKLGTAKQGDPNRGTSRLYGAKKIQKHEILYKLNKKKEEKQVINK